jgi:hypothetical protein
MARDNITRTHQESLDIIPNSAHGDVPGTPLLRVFATDTLMQKTTDALATLKIDDKGRSRSSSVYIEDDFVGVNTTDINATPRIPSGFKGYIPGTADTSTIAVTAGVPGTAEILSGTTANDTAFLQNELVFEGQYSPMMEARLTLSSASAVRLCIGFVDAAGLANAGALTLTTATFNAQATNDGAMFLYDTGATTKTLRAQGVKATVLNATPVDTGLLPVAATYNIFRVELVDNGATLATVTAKFYVDDVLVATITNALTRTTALTPFVSVSATGSAAAKYVLVDYVKVWTNRS